MWSLHSLVCNLAIRDFFNKFINIMFDYHATDILLLSLFFYFSSWPCWSITQGSWELTLSIFITSSRIVFLNHLPLLSDRFRLGHEEGFPNVFMCMIADSNSTPYDEVIVWVYVPRPLYNFVGINELEFWVLR
jgi:hypothetical protein